MRKGAVLGVLVAWSLACAGAGGDGEVPADAPPADGVGEVAPVPDDGTTASLLWLAEEGGACALKTQVIHSEPRTLASLGGKCPEAWQISVPPAAVHYMVYGPDHAWLVEHSGVRQLEGTKDGIQMMASDGTDIYACGEPAVEAKTDEEGNFTWVLDGKTYTYQSDLGAELIRRFKLGPKGWVEDKVGPIGLSEGMSSSSCWVLEGWPEGNVDLSPSLEPAESEWRDARDAELDPLKAIDDGPWHISQQGGVATRSEWLEGLIFFKPVVSRPSETAPWAPVPELTDKGGAATYDVHGPFLLINTMEKGIVRDVRTGQDVWSSTERAVFWREGLEGLEPPEGAPEAGEPTGDAALGEEPEGEEPAPGTPPGPQPPSKIKSKVGKGGKVKGKVKAKAPGAAP
jgi:hypothetical protein